MSKNTDRKKKFSVKYAKNACRFCDYAAACHFDPGRGGDCKRWLARVSVKEFWEQLEEEH